MFNRYFVNSFFVLFFALFSFAAQAQIAPNVITPAQISGLTANEMWIQMVNPSLKVSTNGSLLQQNLPLITHNDILNALLGMPDPLLAYQKLLDIALLVNPGDNQIITQVNQAVTEMDNAANFNITATKLAATSGINSLFPLISSSAMNARNGMLNFGNNTAIPSNIFQTSISFRNIVNDIQQNGATNLNGAALAVGAGGTILSNAGLNGGTVGQAGLLGSGQAGVDATSISDAMDMQIRQMLQAPTLAPPTYCECITWNCACLAGRIGMLIGIINQTQVQRTQKIDLDNKLVDVSDVIVKAVQDSGNRIVTNIKKTEELKSQQKKAIFDLKQTSETSAINDNNVLSKTVNKQAAVKAAKKAVANKTIEENNVVMSKKTALSGVEVVTVSRELFNVHNNDYCSQEDKDAGYCNNVASVDLRNADVRASNFFVQEYEPENLTAANIFVDYIINNDSLQSVSLPAKLVKSNDTAKQLRAKQLERLAYSSVPLYILTSIKNDRVKITGLGDKLDMDLLIFGNDVSLMNAYEYRSGLQEKDVLDMLGGAFSMYKTPYQVKMMELTAFKDEMLVKNYVLKQKIMALIAAENADEMKIRNANLQDEITNIDTE